MDLWFPYWTDRGSHSCVQPGIPEGMMLAILFMNAFAPLIDFYVVDANIKRRIKRAAIANK
jgi:Na+-transporting NADH:ubiquinone oxidoreductase subunit B